MVEELSTREIKILKILTETISYLPVYIIAEQLNISTKTVYRDVENIIKKREDIVLKRKQGKGIKLQFLNFELEKLDTKKISKFSLEERRMKIFYELLNNTKKYISIETLSEKYFVSKSSIVNDLNYIEKNLLGTKLKLEKTRNGTRILGEESNIRLKFKELINNYSFIINEFIETYSSERINEETLNEIALKFKLSDIKKIEKIVNKYEKKLPYTIGDLYYTNLIIHILIAIDRIKSENYVDFVEVNNISDRQFYNEAENIALELEKVFNIILPFDEIYYIYKYLVSTGVGSLNVENLIELDGEVEKIVETFLKYILKNEKYSIDKNSHAYYIFKLHIRALLKRLKYKIQIKNPLCEKIKEQYKDQFYKMKKISEKVLKEKISDDEIAYLTVYIEAILEKETSKRKIILVCHSGFGTSEFLKKKLEENFDNLKIVDVLSSRELKTYNLSNIDFIISTVKLDKDIKNVVNVSVLLQEDDINKINKAVYGDGNEIFSL